MTKWKQHRDHIFWPARDKLISSITEDSSLTQVFRICTDDIFKIIPDETNFYTAQQNSKE
jgi:hypothetical protein